MEPPPQISLPSLEPNRFPVGTGKFQLESVMSICCDLLFNIKACQESCNWKGVYDIAVLDRIEF